MNRQKPPKIKNKAKIKKFAKINPVSGKVITQAKNLKLPCHCFLNGLKNKCITSAVLTMGVVEPKGLREKMEGNQ